MRSDGGYTEGHGFRQCKTGSFRSARGVHNDRKKRIQRRGVGYKSRERYKIGNTVFLCHTAERRFFFTASDNEKTVIGVFFAGEHFCRLQKNVHTLVFHESCHHADDKTVRCVTVFSREDFFFFRRQSALFFTAVGNNAYSVARDTHADQIPLGRFGSGDIVVGKTFGQKSGRHMLCPMIIRSFRIRAMPRGDNRGDARKPRGGARGKICVRMHNIGTNLFKNAHISRNIVRRE